MTLQSWAPSFVVGIDFGMTCTGVAYSYSPEWARPTVIKRWPGRLRDSELADKVPTQVGYEFDHAGRRRPFKWGLECNFNFEDTVIEREFKVYLDPNFRDNFEDGPSHNEAVESYKDFMTELYKYINFTFKSWFPDWEDRNVEFLFSMPTTWKDPWISGMVKQWLGEAGFRDSHNRLVKVECSEAEAAAVYAVKQSFDVGDVIMVVDAGGATTDINILELKQQTSASTRLEALTKSEGINVGSVGIDDKARRLVMDHLRQFHANEEDLHWMAYQMMEEHFELYKCGFDGDTSILDMKMTIPAEVNIGRNTSRTYYLRAEQMKAFFDSKLETMFSTINSQLATLMLKRPNQRVKYIVLSGGLGSSKYVQTQLIRECSNGRFKDTIRHNLKVLCAPEPQLAVCLGMVMDRVQQIQHGVTVYSGRCSAKSFGVICRVPWDKILHRGQRFVKDPLDGKKWAEDQIQWLVKEGDPIPKEGFKRPYNLNVPVGTEMETFRAHIVASDRPARELPPSLRFDDVEKVCTITARFREEDFENLFKRVPANIILRRNDHWVANLALKVIAGPADLKFELVSESGAKYSNNHAKISVVWQEPAATQYIDQAARNIYPARR